MTENVIERFEEVCEEVSGSYMVLRGEVDPMRIEVEGRDVEFVLLTEEDNAGPVADPSNIHDEIPTPILKSVSAIRVHRGDESFTVPMGVEGEGGK